MQVAGKTKLSNTFHDDRVEVNRCTSRDSIQLFELSCQTIISLLVHLSPCHGTDPIFATKDYPWGARIYFSTNLKK